MFCRGQGNKCLEIWSGLLDGAIMHSLAGLHPDCNTKTAKLFLLPLRHIQLTGSQADCAKHKHSG